MLGAVATAACAALVSAAFVAVVPSSARAQDAAATTPPAAAAAGAANPIGDIENAKYQFEGRITSNAVYVRSGPSENDYPTMKLDSGATVTVVGVKFDWLKVLPPDGSFCYVAKAFVEKRGDGKLGRVTNTLNVRVGSNLNPMKTKVASKLEPGTDVEIIGDKDEYFTIKPPKDVYLYVAKQFVEPVRAVAQGEQPGATNAPSTQPSNGGASTGNDTVATNNTGTTSSGGEFGTPGSSDTIVTSNPTGPTTAPSRPEVPGDNVATGGTGTGTESQPPSTQPSAAAAVAEAEKEYDQLEAQLAEVDKQPLEQQPLAELSERYQKLAAGGALPESMRRMAEWRVKSIQPRIEDKERYLAVRKIQEETKAKQLALQAEREELEQRIKATGIQYFTAVGTLRNSSLQVGSETLYRLTDPNTGRTLVYLKGNDPKIVALMGQFVGVQGQITSDERAGLKFIAPQGIEACDQAKVNTTVSAQISPPSLLKQSTQGQASTGNE